MGELNDQHGERYLPQLALNPDTGKRTKNTPYRLEVDPGCIRFLD